MPRFRRLLPTLALLAIPVSALAVPERRLVYQPVQDYSTTVDPVGRGRQGMDPAQRINPFLSYTNIGSDFGFIGIAQSSIGWEPGHVCVFLPPGQAGGVWHSLAGRAMDLDQTLDFRKCYPSFINDAFQPRVVGLKLKGHGQGQVKIDIKTSAQTLLWSKVWEVNNPEDAEFGEALPSLEKAKFLNWTAEPGSDCCMDQVALELEMPAIDFPTQVFLTCYAKLSRCYSPHTGLVRDRAHVEDGAFDSVPATGMFCLATAAASKLGIVSDDFARGTLKRTHALVSSLDAPLGVLPHFVRLIGGLYKIHPQTEYSTVDTAIYLHSMLLAAQMLEDTAMIEAVMQTWKRLEFGNLRDSGGRVIHGLKEDASPIPFSWYDWGGETALILLTQTISCKENCVPQMNPNGVPMLNTGFIAELQSLFHPDFDRPEPDLVSKQSWPAIRVQVLQSNRQYFAGQVPPTDFAKQNGIFGLSAGEGRRGAGYLVSGTAMENQTLVHPHYILMAARTENNPTATYALLEKMEDAGLFPPWGLVENIDAKSGESLPMIGSLNAAFESLAAYHLLAQHSKQEDLIYKASKGNAVIREAMKIFWAE